MERSQPVYRSRRAVLAAGAGALGMAFRARVASPAVWPSVGRTDASDDPTARDRLISLLRLLPPAFSVYLDRDETIVSWADYAAQLAAVGANAPSAAATNAVEWFHDFPPEALQWFSAVKRLPTPPALQSSTWRPREFHRLFGFGLVQVDRAVHFGDGFGPFAVRGRFDLAELKEAWAATGYEPYRLSGLDAYGLAKDRRRQVTSIDKWFTSMIHAAILDEITLLFAETAVQMEQFAATVRGESPSLMDDPALAELADCLDPSFVGGELGPGER
jgi:hypothetical protein